MNAALETLHQLLQSPPPDLLPVLLSSQGVTRSRVQATEGQEKLTHRSLSKCDIILFLKFLQLEFSIQLWLLGMSHIECWKLPNMATAIFAETLDNFQLLIKFIPKCQSVQCQIMFWLLFDCLAVFAWFFSIMFSMPTTLCLGGSGLAPATNCYDGDFSWFFSVALKFWGNTSN